jgi:hypothetical protein
MKGNTKMPSRLPVWVRQGILSINDPGKFQLFCLSMFLLAPASVQETTPCVYIRLGNRIHCGVLSSTHQQGITAAHRPCNLWTAYAVGRKSAQGCVFVSVKLIAEIVQNAAQDFDEADEPFNLNAKKCPANPDPIGFVSARGGHFSNVEVRTVPFLRRDHDRLPSHIPSEPPSRRSKRFQMGSEGWRAEEESPKVLGPLKSS